MAYIEDTFFFGKQSSDLSTVCIKVKGTKDKWVVRILYRDKPGIHLDSFNFSFGLKEFIYIESNS